MAHGEWVFCACKFFKRVMFVLCRFPAFSAQYIRDYIDLPNTEPGDLQEYKNSLVTVKRVRASILVLIYTFYTAKNIYVLYALLDSFDYGNLRDNLKPLGYNEQDLVQMNYSLPLDTLKHISCLYTNCTRLGPAEQHIDANQNKTPTSPTALLRDFSRLPTLALCYPMLDRLYHTPSTKIGALGIFAYLVTMYTHILLGSWTTIQQILLPASNDLVMIITSPKVTRRVMRVRTCGLLRDLALSLHNFRLFSIWGCKNKSVALKLTLAVSDQDQSVGTAKRADSSRLMNLKTGHKWRPSYAIQMRKVSGPPSDLDKIEESVGGEGSQRDLLVDPILRDLYFNGRSEHEIRHAIDNCMPVVCTEWWRPNLASILAHVSLSVLLSCILIGTCLFKYVASRVSIEEAAVREFGRQMEKRNCFVWLERANSFVLEKALSMNQLNYSWDVFSVLDAVTLNFIGGFSGMLLFAYYWLLIKHISVWLAEVRMFIVASLWATRFQHESDRKEAERDICDRDDEERRQEDQRKRCIGRNHFISTRQFYKIRNLREQFKDSIRVFHMHTFKMIQRRDKWTHNSPTSIGQEPKQQQVIDFHLLNSKHSDHNYADRFLAEILFPLPADIEHSEDSSQSFDRIDYDIETMEQVYVNFRLLVGYVRSLNSSIRVLINVAYLLNYGYILASIFCRRRFKDLNEETIFLSVVAFMITNYIIFLSADFHANAKQIQPLFWSLIAQMTYSKNLRVQHLRSLWIKQTVDLDSNGGLALIAYGVPITYVFIIQLVIWTATILVLALKPHGQES